MKIKLSKFQIASVKRTAKNVSMTRRKAEKIEKLIEDNKKLLDSLTAEINAWELPVLQMTGMTSKEVLDTLDENGYCGYNEPAEINMNETEIEEPILTQNDCTESEVTEEGTNDCESTEDSSLNY